jgi:very-short-patch-repair endonuclease
MSYNSNLHIFKYRRSELRNNATKPEVILWSKLKGRQCNNKKFRRQHGFGPYVVDFYCKKLGLVIELDGDTHIGKEEYDA